MRSAVRGGWRGDRVVGGVDRYDLNDESTVTALEHAFGRTLGRTHAASDELPFVSETFGGVLLREPDATARGFPWDHTPLTVAVEVGWEHAPKSVERDYERQAEQAIRYDDEGADGSTPDSLRSRLVSTVTDADVVIRVVEHDEGDRAGVKWRWFGRDDDGDDDGDDACEEVTGVEISPPIRTSAATRPTTSRGRCGT